MKLNIQKLIGPFIFILATLIYWFSAFPTITWWDTLEYSSAVKSLGVTAPPGSILLTLISWPISKLSVLNTAYLLNLFSGFTGAALVYSVFLLFKRVASVNLPDKYVIFTFLEIIAILCGSLIIVCSVTIWEYSTKFTPYILTGLFTTIILHALLSWWENAFNKNCWKEIAILAFLIGLDFSVHRTNWILIPGIIVFMLIRNYSIFLKLKNLLAAIVSVSVALSLQLLYIPLSRSHPDIDFGEVNSLDRLWDFISLKQYGGNFLANIFDRTAAFWSYQFWDIIAAFGANFFYADQYIYIIGFIPLLLGCFGLIFFFRTNQGFAIGYVCLLLISIFTTAIYFNLPPDYFRSIYRHYIPLITIFSVLIFAGSYYIIKLIQSSKMTGKVMISGLVISLLVLTSGIQFAHNFYSRNSYENYFTEDYMLNLSNSIDKNGILLTASDHDLYSMKYLQVCENKRKDITVLNMYLLTSDWYNQQVQRQYPWLYNTNNVDINRWQFLNWKPKEANIPLSQSIKTEFDLEANSINLTLPALRENNSNLLQDLVFFEIIKSNKWERPLYLPVHGTESVILQWLSPYLKYEGLVYRIVPDSTEAQNISDILLNVDKLKFSDYAGVKNEFDDVSKEMANFYYFMYLNAAEYLIKKNKVDEAKSVLKKMEADLPLEKFSPYPQIIDGIAKYKTQLAID